MTRIEKQKQKRQQLNISNNIDNAKDTVWGRLSPLIFIQRRETMIDAFSKTNVSQAYRRWRLQTFNGPSQCRWNLCNLWPVKHHAHFGLDNKCCVTCAICMLSSKGRFHVLWLAGGRGGQFKLRKCHLWGGTDTKAGDTIWLSDGYNEVGASVGSASEFYRNVESGYDLTTSDGEPTMFVPIG